MGSMPVAPGLPEMAAWGGLLRVGLPVFGELDEATGARTIGVELELLVGGYYTLAGDHQLFLAYATPGAIRLGANLVVHESLELILEGSVALPAPEAPMTLGALLGLVAWWE